MSSFYSNTLSNAVIPEGLANEKTTNLRTCGLPVLKHRMSSDFCVILYIPPEILMPASVGKDIVKKPTNNTLR